MIRITLLIAVTLALMSLFGCANLTTARVHYQLAPVDAITIDACPESVNKNPPQDIVGIALSGGGSRAAVFAAASLEALWEHGLIDLATHISSVSGGSLASSYYIANPPACSALASGSQQETCYREYFREFKLAMRSNFLRSMEWRQFTHIRWFSNSMRATSLQEAVDERFLNATTFGDLADKRARANNNSQPSPVLLINASSYDNGRRFVFTNMCLPTIPAPAANLIAKNPLDQIALRSLTFSRENCSRPAPRDLPLSLAVATSASFPGIGPVTYETPSTCTGGNPEYWHLGDGGLYDNSGIDTLEEVILREHHATPHTLKRALIISIDSGKEDDETQLKSIRNFWLFSYHTGRIVEAFNSRAQGYHDLLWNRLDNDLLNQGLGIERIEFKHTSAKLNRWPDTCKQAAESVQQSPEQIRAAITAQLAVIKTSLRITDCDADLLDLAAHDVVNTTLNAETMSRLKKLGFAVRRNHVVQ